MGHDELEAVARIHLNDNVNEPAQHGKLRRADGVGVVGVGIFLNDGEARKHGNVQLVFSPPEIFVVSVVQPGVPQAVLELGPCGRIAHFLNRKHIRGCLTNGFNDGGGFFARLGLQCVRVAVAADEGILVQVERHDGELALGGAGERRCGRRLFGGGGFVCRGRLGASNKPRANRQPQQDGGQKREIFFHDPLNLICMMRQYAGQCRGI